VAKKDNKKHNPLFHIAKRDPMAWYAAFAVRAAAVIGALVFSAVIIVILTGENPISFYSSMIDGAFGMKDRVWILLKNTAFLLSFALAVTPAFKMKFWNIGAEGQVLISGLATICVMFFFGGKLPTPVLLLAMLASGVAAAVIWAVIPAVAKAFWNTNETLFTLMMNYIAIQFVSFFLKKYGKGGSGTIEVMHDVGIPAINGNDYIFSIVVIAVLTVILYIYLKYSKQGYEISVVGESVNTAKYIGLNVKKVIIRTLVVSGILCGITGFLLIGGVEKVITTDTTGGRGFTAIMVSWLAKFNPIIMIFTSFLIVFLEVGAKQVSTDFNIPEDISDIITGIILFFIIGCEFFLQYKIIFTKHRKENK